MQAPCEHSFIGKPRMCGKCGTRGDDVDVAEERRRIDGAIDVKRPAVPGTELATTPDTSEVALKSLQQAVRAQILAFCDQDINAKTLSRLQRFCASIGQAMVGLESPDALVRDRFGQNSSYGYNPVINLPPLDPSAEADALASAPAYETYGANASRGLIAEATKIGKEMLQVQVDGQKAARRISTLPELVASLVLAKKQKLGKPVIQALEKQIADAGNDAQVPGGV